MLSGKYYYQMKDTEHITVAVTGASGMLGSMVLKFLSADENLNLIATARNKESVLPGLKDSKGIEWRALDAEDADISKLSEAISGAEWVINCIGIIKPYIRDDNAAEIERAVKVNTLFPHRLAEAAELKGARVIQIATDCVYSGAKGNYGETNPHDALDVYGKTKSLGEAFRQNMHHLRCSIIGPEPAKYLSLLEWLVRQPQNARVSGYTNHEWNGVTTLHFAKICRGIIKNKIVLPHIQHIIPSDRVTKANLLQIMAGEYRRPDIVVGPVEAKTAINRTLTTEGEKLNRSLWAVAGYDTPPSIGQMVAELAQFKYR